MTKIDKLRCEIIDEIVRVVDKAEGAVINADDCAFNGRVITFDYDLGAGKEPLVITQVSIVYDELTLKADGWDRESGCSLGLPQEFEPDDLDTDTLNELLEAIK